jgi:predicted phage-related endonuclease
VILHLKNSALDMVSLLKKDIKNLNPTVIQVNKKFRVKVASINDINEFDIFFNKIVNTKFDNYNISVE